MVVRPTFFDGAGGPLYGCLHEARGEPIPAQIAVAKVVVNRVAHPRFPNTVCDVIKQGGETPRDMCQFSWWCDGRSDMTVDQRSLARSRALAREVLGGKHEDPTNGITK